ncbi:MAG: prolyl oligopeptidase family serine peptidase [Planctomycetota bacterium]
MHEQRPIALNTRELTLEHGPEHRRRGRQWNEVSVRVVAPELPPGATAPVVTLVHGFKGFMHWAFFPELAARLARAGIIAVSYNASHNGVSARAGGPDAAWDIIDDDAAFAANTHTYELEDLALVRAWVASGAVSGADPAREGLFGHSRGGGIALLSAAAHAPRALALWAPIDDVDRVDAATKARWRSVGHLAVPNQRTGQVHLLGLDILDEVERDHGRLDILAAARQVACPTLLVHGTDDGAVPFAASERIRAALPEAELLCIEGANHAFGATHPLRAPLHPDLEEALDATLAHFVARLDARPTAGR